MAKPREERQGVLAVGVVGRAVADDRLDPDERELVRARLGRPDYLLDCVHALVAVLHREPLPGEERRAPRGCRPCWVCRSRWSP